MNTIERFRTCVGFILNECRNLTLRWEQIRYCHLDFADTFPPVAIPSIYYYERDLPCVMREEIRLLPNSRRLG